MESANHRDVRGSSKGLFLPLSHLWLVAADDRTTDQLCRLTKKKTKQKYWPFKPDDTVNMGKVRQLCVYFI